VRVGGDDRLGHGNASPRPVDGHRY
jgi:hypothetical protein